MKQAERIGQLVSLIKEARIAYYNGTAIISDKVFDSYIDELASLDPTNKELIAIGAEAVSNWEKYTHPNPMMSLNKVNNKEDFSKWAKDYCKNNKFFTTLKLDGLSVSLEYKEGKLVRGITRGSGIQGEVITTNILKMKLVPLFLKEKISGHVRGEILISKEDFNKYLADKYSNSRNAASGISRRFDGTESEHLSILCYELVSDDLDFKTEEEQFLKLQDLGFTTPSYWLQSSVDEVWDFKEDFQQDQRQDYTYELDGLVVRQNDLQLQREAGISSSRPKGAMAIKFANEARATVITSIDWQTGNSGRITPVAFFEPVEIGGASIQKASLYNPGNVADLGVQVGASIIVERGGDVIPIISEVISGGGSNEKPPANCPVCCADTVMNGENLICPNTTSCPAQVCGRLINWISSLNILEIGDKLLDRLVQSGKVIKVSDLYKLTQEDLASIERMGKKSAKVCHESLWSRNPISLQLLVGSLSIPLVAVSTMEMLATAGYDSLDKLFKASQQDFEKVKGLGPNKAKSLYKGLRENKDMIEELLSLGLKLKEKSTGKLSGKSFCVTGKTEIKRDDLKQMIIDAGGIFKTSVSKGLDYLVTNEESNSSKSQNAKKLGTQVISEKQLLEMM